MGGCPQYRALLCPRTQSPKFVDVVMYVQCGNPAPMVGERVSEEGMGLLWAEVCEWVSTIVRLAYGGHGKVLKMEVWGVLR